MTNVSPVPDATNDDAYDEEWIRDINEAWLAFHPGEELPDDATKVD